MLTIPPRGNALVGMEKMKLITWSELGIVATPLLAYLGIKQAGAPEWAAMIVCIFVAELLWCEARKVRLT
jgi:hypothetical protein